MTDWNASGYARVSELQKAMAEEALSVLALAGIEHVLDVGCGNGNITARIADRVPRGAVVGVDASADMIAFASGHFAGAGRPNLRFEVADARELHLATTFDLIVSFNALHWIPDQERPLRAMRSVVRPGGRATLRLVPAGERKSLEDVIEDTRRSARWERYFPTFRDPYLHLTPEQYGALAEASGWRVRRVQTRDHAWDFESRSAFAAFGSVTFVEWTRRLPEAERLGFVADVLDRYRRAIGAGPREDNVFRFYQMDVALDAG